MKLTMITIETVEEWRAQNKLSKSDVARLFDVEPQNYNNWVYRGSLPKERIARALELVSSTQPNTMQLQRTAGMVPVISWVRAGHWCESPNNYEPGVADEWLMCPSKHSQKTYALRVVGDSMTSSTPGGRSYPQGTIIFVDPEKQYEIGSRVIARLPNSSEATFKVYDVDAGIPYLVPINDRYMAIPMPEGTVICGVIIGSYRPEDS